MVKGDKPAPNKQSLSKAEVRQLPGAFGDPFRAIEALPGVTPMASGVPFFYVRGAPPGNVGYYVDGVRVPYLFHYGLGPSVIHPALVERVDLFSGGYPAKFGRYAGGIVAGETTPPRADLHGEANVRLFDLGALVEGGFAGGRGTALVGGRYSYSSALLSVISPDVVLGYRDYQTRVSYDISPRDQISLFSFGSYDVLGDIKNGVKTIAFGTEFYRADLRFDHRLDGGGNLRWAATLGYDRTRISEERVGKTLLAGTRVELFLPVTATAIVRGGADVLAEDFGASQLAYDDPDNPSVQKRNALFPKRTDVALGAWTDVVWNVSRRIEVTPGLRVDQFRSGGAQAVGIDPRIGARFQVSDDVRIIHAYGISHQPPSFLAPIPGLTPGKLQGGCKPACRRAPASRVACRGICEVRRRSFATCS